jgi:hypothetical protein
MFFRHHANFDKYTTTIDHPKSFLRALSFVFRAGELIKELVIKRSQLRTSEF